MLLIILKLFFLLIAVWFSIRNVVKTYYKVPIEAWDMIIQAVSIVGFVIIQFKLYE